MDTGKVKSTPTRKALFTVIPEAVKKKLAPKHRAAEDLYGRLWGLVTVQVIDPTDPDKKIGVSWVVQS